MGLPDQLDFSAFIGFKKFLYVVLVSQIHDRGIVICSEFPKPSRAQIGADAHDGPVKRSIGRFKTVYHYCITLSQSQASDGFLHIPPIDFEPRRPQRVLRDLYHSDLMRGP